MHVAPFLSSNVSVVPLHEPKLGNAHPIVQTNVPFFSVIFTGIYCREVKVTDHIRLGQM